MFNPTCAVSLTSVRLSVAAVVAGIVLASIAAASADEAEVKVYTIRSIPVTAPTAATIVHLDDARAAEEVFSAGLPDDPTRAITEAHQRMLDGGVGFQRELAAAYAASAEAWSLGITTLPAVVVNRRYVIYGEADVARALARIDAFRKAQQ